LDFAAAGFADLELWKGEGAEIAIAVEAEYVFEIRPARVGGAAFIVEDGDFFPVFDITDRVDGFTIYIVIPSVLSIWKTAVVDAAYNREDTANHRIGT